MKRSLNWFIFALVASAVFFALLSIPINAATSSGQVAANVNVPGTLYTSISPNSVAWSQYPGASNATNTLITVFDNGGNIPGNIFIWGSTDLTYGTNNIAIGNVMWNPTALTSYGGNAVTTTAVNTMILVAKPTLTTPSTNSPIYLGISIPSGTPAGLYTGSVYFENENGSVASTSATLSVTANVQSTCYISLSPTLINFGTIASGANTGTTWNGIIDTDANGNAQATINVYGSNWIYSSNTAITFYVSNTMWSASNTVSYSSGNGLTLSPVSTGIIIPAPTQSQPSTSNTIYFGVGVPGGAPVGAYTQNIIIENSC